MNNHSPQYDCTIYVGKTESYTSLEPSAIVKRPTTQALYLSTFTFEGDEQADPKHHGGIDRAVCHYPYEHYAYWQTRFPNNSDFQKAPAFGENLSTVGLTEENAFMGDIYQLGEAIIQISQPRSPCYKLNDHRREAKLSKIMQETTYCGWLYRVIKEGKVPQNSPLTLLSRPGNLSVKEALSIAFLEEFSEKRTLLLLSSPGLSTSWVRTMQNRLLTGKRENFNYRLFNRAEE